MGREARDGGMLERGKGKGMKKGIQMCYVLVPIPHKECKHDALQACIN